MNEWLGRFKQVIAVAGVVLLTACFSDGSSSAPDPVVTPPVALSTGTVNGAVTGPSGLAVAGASVTLKTATRAEVTVTSSADGRYSISNLAPDERWLLRVAAPGMVDMLIPVSIRAGETSTQDVALYPVGISRQVSATQASITEDVTSGARIEVPANAWRREDGRAINGAVTLAITSIDPVQAASRMPGDYTTMDTAGLVSQIESFGAVNVSVKDSDGQRVNLVTGVAAQLRIPASSRGVLPATVGLYSLDEATGRWTSEGVATLKTSSSARWYEANVPHLSSWNADQQQSTILVEGCVQDARNQIAKFKRVVVEGLDYTGSTSGYTDAEGKFRLAAKRGGTFRISVQGYLTLDVRAPLPVVAGPSEINLQLTTCLQERPTASLPPTIVVQPADLAVFDPARVRFSVVADGAEPLQYQWRKNGVDLPGAKGPVLTFDASVADDGTLYTVTISNSQGVITSRQARLTVAAAPIIPSIPPSISVPPIGRTVQVGGTATFSVVATGTAPLRYQWLRNGSLLAGETSTELRFTAIATDSGSRFAVTVSNAGGSVTTPAALLTVQSVASGLPIITAEPVSQSAGEGETVVFSVTAIGDSPLSYQWLRNGSAITGATSPTYSLVTSLVDSGSLFSARVSNGRGNTVSVEAVLNVGKLKPLGTLNILGDAVRYGDGTFVATDPESVVTLTGPNCLAATLCQSFFGITGIQSVEIAGGAARKQLTVLIESRAASPGLSPGTNPYSVYAFLTVSKYSVTPVEFAIASYSQSCSLSSTTCQTPTSLGIVVDTIQRTITFNNVILIKQEGNRESTTLNGTLRY
jgi:Carboxypeptidase regulatory-like domain